MAATALAVDTSDDDKLDRYVRGVLNSARQIIATKSKAKAMARLRSIDRQVDPSGFDAIRLELAAIDRELQSLKQA
jgi:hypothetical protein